MKGLTGVSLPVARHGGIVSKLQTRGSRALPAEGQGEWGQQPEGVGLPRGPWRARTSPEARRPQTGSSPQHHLGRNLPDLGAETRPRLLPSSQGEWASGLMVGVNPPQRSSQPPTGPSGSAPPGVVHATPLFSFLLLLPFPPGALSPPSPRLSHLCSSRDGRTVRMPQCPALSAGHLSSPGAFSLTAELVMGPRTPHHVLDSSPRWGCANACTGLKKWLAWGDTGCTASVFLKPCPLPLRQQIQGLVTSSLLPAWASALTTLSGLVHSPGAARHNGRRGSQNPAPILLPCETPGRGVLCVRGDAAQTRLSLACPGLENHICARMHAFLTTWACLCNPHDQAHTLPPQVRVLACVTRTP